MLLLRVADLLLHLSPVLGEARLAAELPLAARHRQHVLQFLLRLPALAATAGHRTEVYYLREKCSPNLWLMEDVGRFPLMMPAVLFNSVA